MRSQKDLLQDKAFERRLDAEALDLLGRNIPGGIMGGYLGLGFPLYCVSERMLRYLGYESYASFDADIEGQVLNCIHPEDRAATERKVRAALENDREYEVRYRMRKKDGSYIWVNDIGKLSLEETGREVCISVIRDISQEMEAQCKAARENAKQEQQTKRYDQLFQSVLCGIVQYRLTEGLVRFRDANREAIRIFGYTPEAFWAKKAWDLSALIAPEDRARILSDVKALRQVGDKNGYEYRLLQADGKTCWIVGSAEVIRDIDGEVIVRSVFIDINASKEAELRNLRLSERVEAGDWLLKMALEHTSICEFYYDPQVGRLVFPERACTYYQCAPVYESMPQSFVEAFAVAEDQAPLAAAFECMCRGEKTTTVKFRMHSGGWCRIVMSVISRDASDRPSLVVGLAEDITKEEEMQRALEDVRARDALTGLYVKETGVAIVREFMAGYGKHEPCVMMLLDMDDFTRVNVEEGNVFADAILQDVADILREEARADDVLVRLGGDEFMAFFKGRGKADATLIGPRITEKVKALCAKKEAGAPVSVSIGMCATSVTNVYDMLYRCAESSLLYVKAHGRGQAACYLDTSMEVGVALTQLYENNEHFCNEIDHQAPYQEENLLDFALELLGRAKKLDDAMFLLLARIGKRCGFDRVSILEANPEYLSCRYVYQWARQKSDLQTGRDFYLSREAYEAVPQLYDAEGISVKRVLAHEQLPSCLHAAVWNQGVYAGALAFESRVPDFGWTQEQRKLLKEMTKIVASFIMKARADAVSRAKTDFLSRMSHEIRTPMNAIAGMTTIARSVADDREKVLDCLSKIEAASAYLLRLINDILDMSRIESGKVELNCEDVDLWRQMRKLEQLMTPQAQERRIALQFVNDYDGGPLRLDVLRLHQVLINIIGNALKFTPSGGKVVVTVSVEAETMDEVCLRFSVRDTGIGISERALERIFNVFEQEGKATSAQYGGTGLGLSIASRLVQMMGGVLQVRSTLGKGSEFYFTLPLSFGAQPVEEEAVADVSAEMAVDFVGKRLLLAEDNTLNREIAVSILEMQGFIVESAADGGEALRLFTENPPFYYDAILMDIRMPVLDGLEVTRKIRTLGKQDSRVIPIIAMTANAFDEDTRKSMESGMNGHLTKPIDMPRLLGMLRHCIGQRNA